MATTHGLQLAFAIEGFIEKPMITQWLKRTQHLSRIPRDLCNGNQLSGLRKLGVHCKISWIADYCLCLYRETRPEKRLTRRIVEGGISTYSKNICRKAGFCQHWEFLSGIGRVCRKTCRYAISTAQVYKTSHQILIVTYYLLHYRFTA